MLQADIQRLLKWQVRFVFLQKCKHRIRPIIRCHQRDEFQQERVEKSCALVRVSPVVVEKQLLEILDQQRWVASELFRYLAVAVNAASEHACVTRLADA